MLRYLSEARKTLERTAIALAVVFCWSCWGGGPSFTVPEAAPDADADSDADTDGDADSDTDTESAGGICQGDRFVFKPADLLTVVGCVQIVGRLKVSCQKCVTLPGMESLEEVTEDLIIEMNPVLETLEDFSSLQKVGRDLTITHNDELPGLAGLENLLEVGHDLRVGHNGELRDLEGLSSLQTVGAAMAVVSNPEMTSLQGVPSLETIGSCLLLLDLPVTDLLGLEGVSSIAEGGEISMVGLGIGIIGMPALTSLEGLNPPSQITGALRIEKNPALVDISALSTVTETSLGVTIGPCLSLADLSGLDNLRRVGKRLDITGLPSMTNLSGFGSLEQVEWAIAIAYNDSLESVDAFHSLEKYSGWISIGYNQSLQQCDITSPVVQISGVMEIRDNPSLTTLIVSTTSDSSSFSSVFLRRNPLLENVIGLEGVPEFEDELAVEDCGMTDLEWFGSLERVWGLEIRDNQDLASVDGLENLWEIAHSLQIIGNPSLLDLDGLAGFESFGGWSFSIEDNPQLPTCDAEDVEARLVDAGWGGTAEISGNYDGGTCD